MAIDPYKIESLDGVFLVTFQKGTIVHPQLLIKAINFRKSLDEAGQQNSVWDFRGCLPSDDFGYDAMERVVNHINNYPAATRDLRQAIVVDGKVQYGLSRMYQILARDFPTDIIVFFDYMKAMEWAANKEKIKNLP